MQTIGNFEITKSTFDKLMQGNILQITENMTCTHYMIYDEIMEYGAKRAFQFQSMIQRGALEQNRQTRKTLIKHLIQVRADYYEDVKKEPGHHEVKIYYNVRMKKEE